MKVNLEERHGQLIAVSAEIENDKEVDFLLDQLRPQGEWKMITNAFQETKYQCNQCKHYTRVGDDRNFCPNCGVRMINVKGGANDEMGESSN